MMSPTALASCLHIRETETVSVSDPVTMHKPYARSYMNHIGPNLDKDVWDLNITTTVVTKMEALINLE